MAANQIMRMAWAAALVLTLTGCNKALFPENTPRSQYDRYAELRGQKRPAMEEGPYGNERPAIRDRLKPLEEQ